MSWFDELPDLTEFIRANKKHYYGFIYITQNTITDKYYIGQKKIDSTSKWSSYIGSGHLLLKSIEKYGRDAFQRKIIEASHNAETLNLREEYWIDTYNAVNSDKFYNLIEGGTASEVLASRRSEPVICIDTNYVFKSIVDATLWSKHASKTIRDSFNKKHDISKIKKQLIFKPLYQLLIGCKLCAICAKNFKNTSGNGKYCDECRSHPDFPKRLYTKIDKDISKTLLCYNINDEWVQEKLLEYRRSDVKVRNKYKKLDYPESKVRKSTNKKKIVKEISVKEIPLDIVKHKNEIIKMYNSGDSINKIANTYSTFKFNHNDIKVALKNWDIKIKPTCYYNYQNPIVKEKYYSVKNNKELLVFSYFFELKFWLEKYHTSKINKSFIESKINKGETINGYTILEISRYDFINNIEYYKTVDKL